MGRSYRNKDRRFKKQLKEDRKVRKNKRHVQFEPKDNKDGNKKNRVDSYIFA